VLVLGIGLGVSLSGWHSNAQAASQINKISNQAASQPGSSGATPTTEPIPAQAVTSYTVAPDYPRYIDIPKLTVHARVKALNVTATGQLQAPSSVYDAGWYSASAKPGQAGAMLIDGHISNWTTKGVFYGLNKLTAGDNIKIIRGDGQVFTYVVVKTQLYDAKAVDMASLLVSSDTSKPGLNLISCSGDVIPGTSEFNKRLAVFAVEN